MSKFKTLEEAQEAFDALTAEHAELQKTAAQQDADLKEKDQIIAEIRASKVSKSSLPEFTLNKVAYEVTAASANVDGKIVTAEEICKNKELQTLLVEGGYGIIRKK